MLILITLNTKFTLLNGSSVISDPSFTEKKELYGGSMSKEEIYKLRKKHVA